jgi:hypothetical protein
LISHIGRKWSTEKVDRIVEAHELEPIAYQEAGQAVMAFFEGVPVRPVRIEPEMASTVGVAGSIVVIGRIGQTRIPRSSALVLGVSGSRNE